MILQNALYGKLAELLLVNALYVLKATCNLPKSGTGCVFGWSAFWRVYTFADAFTSFIFTYVVAKYIFVIGPSELALPTS